MKQKSIELRNGKIYYGEHYTKNGITYITGGPSVQNNLIARKNGRKTIYA